MKYNRSKLTRRSFIKGCVFSGALTAYGKTSYCNEIEPQSIKNSGFEKKLWDKISRTPFIDTHQHLVDEDLRLSSQTDTWTSLFSGYPSTDLAASGMKQDELEKFMTGNLDPVEKWRIVAPYWSASKNTGYCRQLRATIKDLYGIYDLNEKSILRLQEAYESFIKPGFYKKILNELAGIESCQVDSILQGKTFHESSQPTLLFQDINFLAIHMADSIVEMERIVKTTGKGISDIRNLGDWLGVIDWWFNKYAPYAVAIKSQAAYNRGLDYEFVTHEDADAVIKKIIKSDKVTAEEKKLLQDFLFWYCVKLANKYDLPVKLHLGYYAGNNNMPLGRVAENPAQASELCRKSPDTRFVFMHIAYPFYQDLIAVAKHYSNAYIDMCWVWAIDPVSAKEFLKRYLVSVPVNKILTFGGDTFIVECTLGYAKAARHGIWRSIVELVKEGWIDKKDAFEFIDPIMHGNARRIFNLKMKTVKLRKAPWL